MLVTYPHCRLHCNRRRICTIRILLIFIMSCVIISLSLVATMKEMFHLSLPNLLRIVFGGSKAVSSSNLEAGCIPSFNQTQHYMNRIDVSRLNLTSTAILSHQQV